jgi:hypothetical protein
MAAGAHPGDVLPGVLGFGGVRGLDGVSAAVAVHAGRGFLDPLAPGETVNALFVILGLVLVAFAALDRWRRPLVLAERAADVTVGARKTSVNRGLEGLPVQRVVAVAADLRIDVPRRRRGGAGENTNDYEQAF